MTDSTRINELQDKMLQAMSIVNGKLLDTISYDTTITATISDNTDKADGKYILTNGSKTFTAYSTVTNYSNNTTVYVTIPNGNWENQKMIIGKKTSDAETPFVFTTPFDTIFDMTSNVAKGSKNISILANGKTSEVEIFTATGTQENPVISSDFTRLGLSTDFCTWLKDAISGTYGIRLDIEYKDNNIVGKDSKTIEAHWTFDNSSMYGDTYNFESYYNQQIVFDISDYGAITKIALYLVQLNNFKKIVNEEEVPYPSVDEESEIALFDNIFVKDVYLCAGHDIGVFQNDYVEIYTEDKKTYDKADHGKVTNKRNINLRWVHVEDGEPKKIEDLDTARDKIRWYRYHIGEPSADAYCGVYWEYLTDKDVFSIVFTPDTEWQQEKIKAIVFRDNVPYRSNELIFENEEIVPSKSTIVYQNALGIVTDDGTNGSYLFYGQNGNIKESEASNKERTLSLNFDPTGTNRNALGNNDYKNVKWYLPCKNTMFNWLNTNLSTNEDGTKYILEKTTDLPKYKIASRYNAGYNDNTITCEYTVEGRTYIGIKEFSFGKFGTMGIEQTLEIKWIEPNMTAINLDNLNQNYQVQVSVTDKEGNNLIGTAEYNSVVWSWYKNTNDYISIVQDVNDASICSLKPQSSLVHEQLYILQVAVGNLTSYFNIPLKSGDCTHIEGTQEVYYQANGIPETYRNPYQLFNGNMEITTNKNNWSVISTDTATNNKKRYDPTIDDNKRLQVLQTYVDNAPLYGIKCVTNNAQWTQPILVIQNNYPSSVINNWDGKTLQMDSDTGSILATALSAGSKDSQNRFTGVMIGDWSNGKLDTEPSVSNRTGVYGLHQGTLSYGFMDDGKAFIGKSGIGRIEFDGNTGIIQSANYKSNNQGIKMDLTTPYLLLNNDEKNSSYSVNTYPFQIGSNFRVKWDGTIQAENGEFTGHIEADSGTIGSWIIDTDGTLASDSSTSKSIILDATNGIITLGSRGKIQVGSNITIYGNNSKIEVGDDIVLDGKNSKIFLTAKQSYATNGGYGPIYIKDYSGNTVGSLGMVYGLDGDTNKTTFNVGLKTTSSLHSIVLESERNIRLSVPSSGHIWFNCDAQNQHGIYARFA